jgi:hypothetical protein
VQKYQVGITTECRGINVKHINNNPMTDLLNNSTQLSISEYLQLSNPIFKGQTSVDSNNMYWIIFEQDNKLYKFHIKL